MSQISELVYQQEELPVQFQKCWTHDLLKDQVVVCNEEFVYSCCVMCKIGQMTQPQYQESLKKRRRIFIETLDENKRLVTENLALINNMIVEKGLAKPKEIESLQVVLSYLTAAIDDIPSFKADMPEKQQILEDFMKQKKQELKIHLDNVSNTVHTQYHIFAIGSKVTGQFNKNFQNLIKPVVKKEVGRPKVQKQLMKKEQPQFKQLMKKEQPQFK